ncbi:GNAT family N-acetyltransferase [uncultured Clostridium sp.]|uniref:GNAT family N-acetyltransferase n=1 Tax=uncultured Clostridium sp. TaxID=59620 RepID=UPI0028E510E9|nr:GNAT family N-acetyltransferase [uncultured Clostridium sp.]
MLIETERLVIRDFQPKDEKNLMKIIWQENVMRFMRDWSENSTVEGRLSGYIEWLQAKKESEDIYENKRYAIILKETAELIGMAGMGLEDTLNEVEMAYFIDEDYAGNGYAAEAVNALYEWCISVSNIPYMILTIDCENTASCKVAEKAQFKLFEKRTPIGHKQLNMESDSYFYYRRYR